MENKDSIEDISKDKQNVSARRVKERRNELELSRKNLAEKIGITIQILANIECGRTRLTSLRAMELERMTFYLKCTKDFLLGKSDSVDKKANGLIVPVMIDPDFISDDKMKKAMKEFPQGFSLLYEATLELSTDEKAILVKILRALLNKNEGDESIE